MSILSDIRTEIAQLEKLVPTPAEPFGYGRDLSCVADLTADMQEVDPFSVQALAESLTRFWTTDRDSIPDAPGRGCNMRRLLNRAFTNDELRAEESMAVAEALQDDRFEAAEVTLTITQQTRTATLLAKITPYGTNRPFEFVLAVDTDGQTLLELLS